MGQVTVEGEFGASADNVWTLVGDFVGMLEFLAEPMGASVESEGDGVRLLRKATLGIDVYCQLVGEGGDAAFGDPGPVIERLDVLDNAHRRLVYSMIEGGPMPLMSCSSTVQLEDVGQGRSRVTWTGTFEPAGVSSEVAFTILRDMYAFAIETLQTRFGS